MQENEGAGFSGLKNEIILTAPSLGTMEGNFASAFDLQIFEGWEGYSVENGVVTCDYIDDRYKEYLQYLNLLYKENILDKEIFAGDWSRLYEKIAEDKVGIVVCYSGFANIFKEMTTYGQETGEHTYKFGPPLKGPSGSQFMMRREREAGDSAGITRECKDPVLAVMWLDYMYASPDSLETRYWGFEGISYTINEKGERERLMPEDGSSWNIAPLGCGQIPMPHQQTVEGFLRGFDDVQWYLDATEMLQPYFKSADIPHITYSDEELEIVEQYNGDLETYRREMEAKFISGEESFDKWDNYIEFMKGLNVDALVGVWQSIYDRTR